MKDHHVGDKNHPNKSNKTTSNMFNMKMANQTIFIPEKENAKLTPCVREDLLIEDLITGT